MKASAVNKYSFVRSVFVFSIVLIFGIAFTFFAVKLNGQTIPENYVETEAKIIRIEEVFLPDSFTDDDGFPVGEYEYHVFVEYSYDGKTYSDVEYGGYDSSMVEGDTVLLYLNPDNPAEFMGDPSGNIVFLIIGIVITVVGIAGLGYTICKKKGMIV